MGSNFLDMGKQETIEVRGRIEEVLPGAKFRVILENELEVIAHLSGKMRVHNIRLGVGDEIKVELSPYDLTKGRITFRFWANFKHFSYVSTSAV